MLYFSEYLEKSVSVECAKVESLFQMQAMLKGEISAVQYVEFLCALYPVVSNFCPIMAIAAGNSACRDVQMMKFFYDHIFEERGHEQLIVNDLQAFDVDTRSLDEQLPMAPVQVMLAFNREAANVYPPAVLGMIYVLSLIASLYADRVASAVAASMNRSADQGFSFLVSHGQLDKDHVDEIRDLLCSIKNEETCRMIVNAIQVNFYCFRNIISCIHH